MPATAHRRSHYRGQHNDHIEESLDRQEGNWLISLVDVKDGDLESIEAAFEAVQAFVLGSVHACIEGDLIDKRQVYDYVQDYMSVPDRPPQQGYSPRDYAAFESAIASAELDKYSGALGLFGSSYTGNTLADFVLLWAALEALGKSYVPEKQRPTLHNIKTLWAEVLASVKGLREAETTLKEEHIGRLYGLRSEYLHNGYRAYPTAGQVLLLRRLFWLLFHHAMRMPLNHLLIYFAPIECTRDDGNTIRGPTLSARTVSDLVLGAQKQ